MLEAVVLSEQRNRIYLITNCTSKATWNCCSINIPHMSSDVTSSPEQLNSYHAASRRKISNKKEDINFPTIEQKQSNQKSKTQDALKAQPQDKFRTSKTWTKF